MKKSLLFIPDISGFTEFVQLTEVAHSQHVIAELLEILIDATAQEFQLAEIEGDALFFYKEGEILSLEKLLSKVETVFTAFYSHLKLLKTNRICPCNACASAPNLELKIIVHSAELQFMTVQDKRKPFGSQVIEVHRLMKNSIDSENYLLLSKELADDIQLPENYHSRLFDFNEGSDRYDGKELRYFFSIIDQNKLILKPLEKAKKIRFEAPSLHYSEKEFPISAPHLFEYITNFTYRHHWVQGAIKYEYNEDEVTKIGTEHICVINGKHLNIITVIKDGEPGQLIYGEMSKTPFLVDEFYIFYIVTQLTNNSCKLKAEIYWKVKSPFKKIIITPIVIKIGRKNVQREVDNLFQFVNKLGLRSDG
ncbi:MAG: DUF2652 domain-containing protein [Bacteroidales bacterium]|nr:DUF2652 domain-containing protein [Bacteroidales bacterium]